MNQLSKDPKNDGQANAMSQIKKFKRQRSSITTISKASKKSNKSSGTNNSKLTTEIRAGKLIHREISPTVTTVEEEKEKKKSDTNKTESKSVISQSSNKTSELLRVKQPTQIPIEKKSTPVK